GPNPGAPSSARCAGTPTPTSARKPWTSSPAPNNRQRAIRPGDESDRRSVRRPRDLSVSAPSADSNRRLRRGHPAPPHTDAPGLVDPRLHSRQSERHHLVLDETILTRRSRQPVLSSVGLWTDH